MRTTPKLAPSPGSGLDGRAVDAFLVGSAVAVNVGGVIFVAGHNDTWSSFDALGIVLLLSGPTLLWWRRRYPSLVLVGCVATTWFYLFGDNPGGPVYGPMIVALVSAIMNGARPAAYAVVLGTLIARLGTGLVPGREAPSIAAAAGLAAWLCFLLAMGELLRHRQALAEEQRQRLRTSLEAQADQIRREAAEQRLRLARDLHDVLGHHLAVINVQAKAGLHLHASDRPGVPEAMQAVQEASCQALEDVQAFLDTLRGPAEDATQDPSPSLADLESLVSSARAAGLVVHLDVRGKPRRLPAPQDLAASRVILESLTNVLRHAGRAETRVGVEYERSLLTVRVDNVAGDGPSGWGGSGTGRGIAGMRARVAAHGGTLTAGPAATFAWSVVATVPLPEEWS